jgi:2-iminobutanoate/2-iminopropanoate deaminase
VNIYLRDLFDFTRVNEVYASYFHQQLPARTTIGGVSLPKGVNIEIDCIARQDRGTDA